MKFTISNQSSRPKLFTNYGGPDEAVEPGEQKTIELRRPLTPAFIEQQRADNCRIEAADDEAKDALENPQKYADISGGGPVSTPADQLDDTASGAGERLSFEDNQDNESPGELDRSRLERKEGESDNDYEQRLRNWADELGIEHKGNWGIPKLTDEIEDALDERNA